MDKVFHSSYKNMFLMLEIKPYSLHIWAPISNENNFFGDVERILNVKIILFTGWDPNFSLLLAQIWVRLMITVSLVRWLKATMSFLNLMKRFVTICFDLTRMSGLYRFLMVKLFLLFYFSITKSLIVMLPSLHLICKE